MCSLAANLLFALFVFSHLTAYFSHGGGNGDADGNGLETRQVQGRFNIGSHLKICTGRRIRLFLKFTKEKYFCSSHHSVRKCQ